MGVDRAYIPLRDFKDRFYPGRKWKANFSEGAVFSQPIKDANDQNADD